MTLFTLHLELAEPYQAASRALDMVRKMGFELMRLRLGKGSPDGYRLASADG